MMKNHQWVRVSGSNLAPQNAVRAESNKGVLGSPSFTVCCEAVGIKVTKRQASKWNNRKGAAWNYKNNVMMNGYVYPVTE